MAKSRNGRTTGSRAVSDVHPATLAVYRRAARAPTLREDVRLLLQLVNDYEALVTTGDLICAMGAGIELIDVALRVATTPSADARERDYKTGFFGRFFASMAETLNHPAAAHVAAAALAAERTFVGASAGTRH